MKIDDLKSGFDAAPLPDPQAKADNIALAQKNFAALQAGQSEPRQTSRKPLRGLKVMFDAMTSKTGLAMTTGLVACGFLFITPIDDGLLDMADQPAPTAPEIAPVPQTEFSISTDAVMTEESAADLSAGGVQGMIAMDTTAAAPQALSRNAQPLGSVAASSMSDLAIVAPQPTTKQYPNAEQNPLKIASDEPVSTFSIDVDAASYAVVRSSLSRAQLPPSGAVRIEEMINYFSYDYLATDAGDVPFRATTSVFETPWNADTQLLHIGIQGTLPDVSERPPLNLVFLIDTSGSMNQPDKLPLLISAFKLMLSELRPEDEVSIITYAGSAGQVLAPTPASDRATILAALNRLSAGGSTAGQAGLRQAYAIAAAMSEDGEIARVILATDGDFNVGLNDPDTLKDYITTRRDSGTYLSVLGFGRGNLNDAVMQSLAQNGNGIAAYIDTLSEAQKVLVDQLSGALFPIANDVKVQVEFNPSQIAKYRLIGYETRALNREDFNNDAVDAGEIGAGHSVTAIYEITPVGSAAQLTDPLRYGAASETAISDELAFLRLRYKEPSSDTSQLIETPISVQDTPSQEAQFAAAIAGFGQLLTGAQYLNDWGWGDAIALANNTRGDDPFGYRAEAVRLMRLAQSLSQ
ncbi:MAG: VWA domain-containing protein [Paracoccaceae bacterium]|jgi:Ca-activated chloride channel family protein|nr:VWA domain-containing protein [Paracoccaceae bacterium]